MSVIEEFAKALYGQLFSDEWESLTPTERIDWICIAHFLAMIAKQRINNGGISRDTPVGVN